MGNVRKYKDHEISFDEHDGKFIVVVNGIFKRFASLKSAMNYIDKVAVIDFKPIEVLVVDSRGYAPSTYSVRQVKIVGYREEKKYRGSFLTRYFTVAGQDREKDIVISRQGNEIYALKDRAKLEANVKEINEQERIQYSADARVEKLNNQRRVWSIDIDPRPEAD